MIANRFHIFYRNGAYSVSIPNYGGGEVVRAEVHDTEIERLRKLLDATAALAHSLADDESGIDENETYKAAIAASQQ